MKEVDENGYRIYKDSKITKEGVFPYFNSSVGIEGKADDEVVYVYRPAEEISKIELIEDFNNRPIPLTDEHEMIGEGMTAPEDKGVEGTLDKVWFDSSDNSLRGNITVYSRRMQSEIDSGKKELSLGYFCQYDIEAGYFNGKRYDAIQRFIRPNHIALVEKGRSGSDVRVLDRAICYDSIETELIMETKDIEHIKGLYKDLKAETFDELKSSLMACDFDEFREIFKEEDEEEEKKTEDEEEEKASEDEDEEEKKTEDEELEEEKKGEDKCGATDSADVIASLKAEIAALRSATDSLPKSLRADMKEANDLAIKLSDYVGTFDASDMTSSEVAEYGCKKLGLKVEKGMEKAALAGYLKGASKEDTFSMDSAFKEKAFNVIEAYKRGEK